MSVTSTGRHHVEHVMGMAVSIDIRDVTATDETVEDVVAWLHHVDRTFSTYDADSTISRLGRGELSLADATPEVREVLTTCERIRHVTGGAFDVFEVPAPNGTTLDPSGYVKGWSVETAAQLLEARGCANFCINAGGDIVLRGHTSGADPWRVGIRHPEEADALALVVEASGPIGIATSAIYERGPHIIDPRSGDPVFGLASVTVVGPDLGVADAYATSVFVMGREGLDWIADQPGYEAYIITNDELTRWTDGFTQYRAQD
jgi:thiamine biosynthesis lipoprotein